MPSEVNPESAMYYFKRKGATLSNKKAISKGMSYKTSKSSKGFWMQSKAVKARGRKGFRDWNTL